MNDRPPAYLVAPPSSLRDRVAAVLDPLEPRIFDGVGPFLEEDPAPGVAYLPAPDPGDAAVLRAVEGMARGRGEWTPVVVREEEGGLVARTLSLGYARPLADTVAAVTGAAEVPLLELRAVLREISRARHDINNPLTSALAEAQLLHMDATDPETRAALETILEQLRRIRDLVGATVHLRPLE